MAAKMRRALIILAIAVVTDFHKQTSFGKKHERTFRKIFEKKPQDFRTNGNGRHSTIDSGFVNVLNGYRRLLGKVDFPPFSVTRMNKLRWDYELAQNLIPSCHPASSHVRRRSMNRFALRAIQVRPSLGVASGNGTNVRLEELVSSWFQEKMHYDYELNLCLEHEGCQNFLQLVHQDAETVGCAVNTCDGTTVLVCAFSPGYSSGRMPFTKGSSCTRCQASLSFCDDGLCVPCNSGNWNQCACTKTCKGGRIGQGVLDESNCSCRCEFGKGPNCDEECRNPSNYLNYDECENVRPEECHDDSLRPILEEFCPEQCLCRRHPLTQQVARGRTVGYRYEIV